MQTFALLWFELQVAQQCLRETFAQSQVPAKARNLDSPSRVGTPSWTRCYAPVRPIQLPPLRPHSKRQIPRGAAHKQASKVSPIEVRKAAQVTYENAHVTYERDQRLFYKNVIVSQISRINVECVVMDAIRRRWVMLRWSEV
jgi:hypothetical protein